MAVTDPKPRLHCFLEITNVGSLVGRQFNHSFVDVNYSASPIIHLETLSVDDDGSALQHRLLVVHQDGEVRFVSPDLQSEDWKAKVISQPAEQVEFALVLNLEQASRSLLKNREDVLAMLGSDISAPHTHLLVLITRFSNDTAPSGHESILYLRILHIELAENHLHPLKDLISLTLPEPKEHKIDRCNYSWHGANGTVFQSTPSFLAIYDLSGTTPQLINHLRMGNNSLVSSLRLSPALVAISTSKTISIVNVQYNSLQAEQILDQLPKDQNTAAKHRYTMAENRVTRLLSYFSPLDLVILLCGRKLLAIQISTGMEQENRSRKRKRKGLLIDSIGRGLFFTSENSQNSGLLHGLSKTLGTQLPNAHDKDGWNSTKASLDSLFKNKKIEEFESIMASELKISEAKDQMAQTKTEVDRFIDTASGKPPDLRKVHYLLSKIFLMDRIRPLGEEKGLNRKLKISWFPDRLCHWLINHGLLSVDYIEASLKTRGVFRGTECLKIGAYTQALVEWDSSLKTLHSILISPVPLDAREVVHATKYLMDLPNSSELLNTTKLLTNDDVRQEDVSDQKMKFEDVDNSISSTPLDSMHETNRFLRLLLESILVRLNAFSSFILCQALKSVLLASELRSLVDLLRMELARGRWLSPYVEDGIESLHENLPNNGQVCIIAKLLNCAIDSIGTGGWILGASVTDDLTEMADTLAYMKAEISATLEGIEEATYLMGMLGEILLYGKTAEAPQVKNYPSSGGNQKALHIHSLPVDGAGIERSALPLGLKAAQRVSTMKVGAGGELMGRSRRDIGKLKSKMVGKYSFDRIVV